MQMHTQITRIVGLAALSATGLLVACGQAAAPAPQPPASGTEAPAAAAIPANLAPFGDGYPNPGDACRRLGESAATANWLDDSAALVGCPTAQAAAAIGGKIVATVAGVSIVSVPLGDANVGMAESQPAYGMGDAKVAGTDYHATTILNCSVDSGKTTVDCDAGVKRNWGEQGKHLVEVTKPDGRKRAIFFTGTTPTGADSAQSDGSAAWKLTFDRKGDETLIKYGPERYVIVDALILGG